MTFYHNHVTVAGNLTRDPELRTLTSERQVANFSIAVNRRYRSGEELREETTFVDCESWGRTAELVHRYLRKGSPAFIEGRLRQDSWEDRDGRRQQRIRIVANKVHFLPSASGSRSGSASSAGSEVDALQAARHEAPHEAFEAEDAPF